jgi:hypothetical protein
MGRDRRSTSDEVEALPHILGAGCSLSVGGPMPSPNPVSPIALAVDIVAAVAGGTS